MISNVVFFQYTMQVLVTLDMKSILDIDDIKFSISGTEALQVLDMLDMISIFEMDNIKYIFWLIRIASTRHDRHEINPRNE